jgi:folate-binding protein YgfZ
MSQTRRYSILENRAVISLSGGQAVDFLQNLVTNDIAPVDAGRAVYAALLTPQGKYLFDFFIVRHGDRLLLDCEAARQADLIKRLSFYRLRAPIEIADAGDSYRIAAGFGDEAAGALSMPPEAGFAADVSDGRAFVDPRLVAAGVRIIAADPGAMFEAHGFAPADGDAYEAHRLSLALPDSSRDLIVDKSFMLESNLDALHGVDFSKGCFVGQEVTARTKYRGLVRRRLIGVDIEGEAPAAGATVEWQGKDAGTLMSAQGGKGLALLRLEAVAEAMAGDSAFTAGGSRLWPRWPEWLPREEIPSD